MSGDSVVWIKVRHPSFDLAGLILSSLTLAVLFAVASTLIGTLLAIGLIRRRRAASVLSQVSALNAPPEPEPSTGRSSLATDKTDSGAGGWQDP